MDEIVERLVRVEMTTAELVKKVDDMSDDIRALRDKCSKDCVMLFISKDQFIPVRNIVYGMAGLIMTSVVVALLSLVIRR